MNKKYSAKALKKKKEQLAQKRAIDDYMVKVFECREEILTAFVAKYGVGPEDVVQVEKKTDEGVIFYVRAKTEYER